MIRAAAMVLIVFAAFPQLCSAQEGLKCLNRMSQDGESPELGGTLCAGIVDYVQTYQCWAWRLQKGTDKPSAARLCSGAVDVTQLFECFEELEGRGVKALNAAVACNRVRNRGQTLECYYKLTGRKEATSAQAARACTQTLNAGTVVGCFEAVLSKGYKADIAADNCVDNTPIPPANRPWWKRIFGG